MNDKICGTCKYIKKYSKYGIYREEDYNNNEYECTHDECGYNFIHDYYDESCDFYEPKLAKERICRYCQSNKMIILTISAIRFEDKLEKTKVNIKPNFCPNCGRKLL